MIEAETNGEPLPRKLLALDGGGLMGIISLGVLTEIETQLRKVTRNPDYVLRDYFDFIGGTSTGAIIAAGLMLGRSVGDIRKLYLEQGEAMFKKASLWLRVRSGFSHKYVDSELKRILQHEFSDRTVAQLLDAGELPIRKHLLMVMRNASTDAVWSICTNPLATYNDRTRKNCNLNVPLWQLVRASTAAPSFFRPEFIKFGDTEYSFVDGGLTPHNNPALKMFEMATVPEYRIGWKRGADNLLIVSVGTGIARAPVARPSRQGTWLGGLAKRTPPILMRGVSIENDVTCRSIGMCRFGNQIDRELDAMLSKDSSRAFSYVRYDADLSPEGMLSMGLSYDGTKLAMDKVKQIPIFDEIGQRVARTVDVKQHFGNFAVS